MSLMLSARQFSLVGFFEGQPHGRITLRSAAELNQTTLGSFVKRGYVKQLADGSLVATPKLKTARQEFEQAEILRKHVTMNLSNTLRVTLSRLPVTKRRAGAEPMKGRRGPTLVRRAVA